MYMFQNSNLSKFTVGCPSFACKYRSFLACQENSYITTPSIGKEISSTSDEL